KVMCSLFVMPRSPVVVHKNRRSPGVGSGTKRIDPSELLSDSGTALARSLFVERHSRAAWPTEDARHAHASCWRSAIDYCEECAAGTSIAYLEAWKPDHLTSAAKGV